MTLKAKFRVMIAVSAAGLLALTTFWIQSQHSSLLSEKLQKTKNLVEVPYSVIEKQYQQETEGKINRIEAQRQAIEAIRAMRYEGGNYFWINDDHPKMIMHPTKPELDGTDLTSFKDPSGKAVFVEFVKAAQNPAGDYVSYLWPKPGKEQPVPKLSFVKRFAPWGWVIGTGIYIDDVDSAWRKSALTAAGLALACLVPLVVVSIVTSRSTLLRLQDMVERFKDVAEGEGDLTKRIPVTAKDEIGELATWFNVFLDKLHDMIQSITSAAHQAGNASEGVSSTSQQISANSQETSAQANAVSAATEEVNRNLQTVATATEEMSASVQEIAKNATEAAKVAGEGMKTAAETNVIVAKLGQSSAEIGQVIKVITAIAQKTDLLALNATVEAARAGKVGAGFAVVANEVKELAKQTATETEDISKKIETIQVDAKNAVQAIKTISGIIDQVNAISSTIATAVEEQSATTSEISRNLTEAAKGSREVAQNIQGVAQAAESTSRGATETQEAAQSLVEISTMLRQLVGQFKIATDGSASQRGKATTASVSLDFARVKAAHRSWRLKLRGFLDGRENLAAGRLSSHRDCDLGKWLYGDGAGAYHHIPEFQQLQKRHEEMHSKVRRVVELKDAGKAAEAEREYLVVCRAADNVVGLLDKLEAQVVH
ncbi:MAG TPA: cache domain-containing protein [Candidatus Sulfotelmatobacter sp.]|nr:cache domain-containing protein [Candidatus Sulfotelmatobacter sp.]